MTKVRGDIEWDAETWGGRHSRANETLTIRPFTSLAGENRVGWRLRLTLHNPHHEVEHTDTREIVEDDAAWRVFMRAVRLTIYEHATADHLGSHHDRRH